MKRPFSCGVLAMAAGLGSGLSGYAPRAVPASDPLIVYEGRYAVTADGAVRLGFPGVSAHLRFRGRTIALRVRSPNDNLYFDVQVDGGEFTLLRVHQGEGTYPLAVSGDAPAHTVTIVRRNEYWQGVCEILGFALSSDSELVAPPALPPRKLLFIGDSVTCGELTAYQPGRDFHNQENSNARLSYGMLLAERLSAQCHLVSCGGRGLIRDWQGIRDGRNAPQFYELTLPDDPALTWNHTRYVPDAVGIQLGTNDFSQGIPDQNEFVVGYVEFIRKIQRDAPHALIFVMDSPMVNDDAARGPRRTALHAYLVQIVAQVGSPHVILAPLSYHPGVPGNSHPTGRDHETMADELEPVLRKALAW